MSNPSVPGRWRNRLQNCNLNHLVVLEAVIAERHITRAGLRLGMSQPAVSRILKSLREILNDPILVRGATGYQLSPRALELEPALHAWLRDAAQIVGGQAGTPDKFDDEIRIAALDDCQLLFLNPIRLALADDAPGLKLRFVSQWGQEFEQLHEGRVDYVIDLAPDIALALPSERLFASDWLCAMRATHPAANLPLTLTRYLAFDHALVSTTDMGPGIIDLALPADTPARRIALRLPFFSSLPDLIESSDLVVTLPGYTARRLFGDRAVICRPVPVKTDPYAYRLIWHPRTAQNPVHRWVRRRIADACQAQA
jgi:DNA-binding transcriptional LysR family regulator